MSPEIFRLAVTNDMPRAEWLQWLRDLAKDDTPAARRAALVNIVWHESNLQPVGLMNRVQDLIGRGCFGATPDETFAQDLEAARQAFASAGHPLACDEHGGYCVVGRPPLDENLIRLIEAGKAQVDTQRLAAQRKMTPAERVRLAFAMCAAAEDEATARLLQKQPHLTEAEARRMVRMGTD